MTTATIASLEPDLAHQAATRESAATDVCLLIAWIRGIRNEAHARALMGALADRPGVRSARIVRDRPCLVMVRYRPEQIRALEILRTFPEMGARAKIVAC